MRLRRRRLAHAGLCLLPLGLVAVLVGSHAVSVSDPAPAGPAVTAAELGIGEIEMGLDFGRPVAPPERGPLATVVTYGLALLCPAKFVLLWALQHREDRDMRLACGAPAPGDT